jgi:hypothetical protein
MITSAFGLRGAASAADAAGTNNEQWKTKNAKRGTILFFMGRLHAETLPS